MNLLRVQVRSERVVCDEIGRKSRERSNRGGCLFVSARRDSTSCESTEIRHEGCSSTSWIVLERVDVLHERRKGVFRHHHLASRSPDPSRPSPHTGVPALALAYSERAVLQSRPPPTSRSLVEARENTRNGKGSTHLETGLLRTGRLVLVESTCTFSFSTFTSLSTLVDYSKREGGNQNNRRVSSCASRSRCERRRTRVHST